MYDICLQTDTLSDSNQEVVGTYMTYHGTTGFIEPEYVIDTFRGEQGWKVRFLCLNYDDLPVWVGVPYDVTKNHVTAVEVAKNVLKIGQQLEEAKNAATNNWY